MGATRSAVARFGTGGAVGERAFLGWSQQTRAARFNFNGRTLTLWLGQGYYLFWAMF